MKLWFRAKTYGYGWTPATWQGWFVTLAYVVLTCGTAFLLDLLGVPEKIAVTIFIPLIIAYTVILLTICVKTGESAKWRWGKKN